MQILALAGTHNRQGFDCKRPEFNDWLVIIARQHQDKGLSKTFVAVPDDVPTRILGCYALTLTEVETQALPGALRFKLPRVVPGVRLGRLAVDQSAQGRRLGMRGRSDCSLMPWMKRPRVSISATARWHAWIHRLNCFCQCPEA